MSLTKSIVVDRIEVLELGQIQVRTATVVSEDGVELSRTFHRQVLAPGDQTTGQDQRVIDIAAATWTTAVVAAWDAATAARAD
tara:strand:+ start:345 stop:593 length:249 start_codon:yes stop_codon:yes gene_type:complete